MNTITIGIPAYNEGSNIIFLLREILKQDFSGLTLKKIIISSDGSTDDTVKKAKSIKNSKIEIIDNNKRLGTYARQNQIVKKANSDILVLLNADISIKDNRAIYNLCHPIIVGEADLTAGKLIPLLPKNHIEKALYSSVILKEILFSNYKGGVNVYNCRGPIRAFSKELYKNLVFQKLAGEDAFSYFYAITNGFTFKYANNANCYFKLPTSLKEHERQSIRFEKSKTEMKSTFDGQLVNQEYSIPVSRIVYSMAKVFLVDPVNIILFVFINIYTKALSFLRKENTAVWEIAHSSKVLH